jgi:hypothetical protein
MRFKIQILKHNECNYGFNYKIKTSWYLIKVLRTKNIYKKIRTKV